MDTESEKDKMVEMERARIASTTRSKTGGGNIDPRLMRRASAGGGFRRQSWLADNTTEGFSESMKRQSWLVAETNGKETYVTKKEFEKALDKTEFTQQSVFTSVANWSKEKWQTFLVNSFCFWACFYVWFSIPGLIPLMSDDLGLTKADKKLGGILSVCVAIFIRSAIGPFVFAYGPKNAYRLTCLMSLPFIIWSAFMTDSTSFLVVRFFVGIMSAGFVPCQSWNPLIWHPSEVGFVNGMSAGIGNFGAGVAAYFSTTIGEATTWRFALGMTIALTIMIMIALHLAPTPPLPQPKKNSAADKSAGWNNFKSAVSHYSTWILMLNYATCFGVELYVYNNLGPYLKDKFEVSNSEAQFLVFIFGCMNLGARALGGYASDRFKKQYVQAFALAMIGIFLLAFTMADSYALSIFFLVCFGFFCMISEGSTYGCVHCVGNGITSSVVGLVGSFGTFGAVMWGIMYAQIDDYEKTHIIICIIIGISSFASLFLQLVMPNKSKDNAKGAGEANNVAMKDNAESTSV